MKHVLLVEDDPILGDGLKLNLEMENFRVTWARDLTTALKACEEQVDLILLDLMLPDGDGLDFCRKVRDKHHQLPIVMLTARDAEDSVVDGFAAGADDYIRKPFGNRELLARILAALRRSRSDDTVVNVSLLPDQRRILVGTTPVDLNRREFSIFATLHKEAGRVVEREKLLSALEREGGILERTLDSHVSHIRTKLKNAGVGQVGITSVYGMGYRLEQTKL